MIITIDIKTNRQDDELIDKILGRIYTIDGVDDVKQIEQTTLQWVGLTLEEIDLLEELYAPPVHPDFTKDASHCLELIRHVEAKLKNKNT